MKPKILNISLIISAILALFFSTKALSFSLYICNTGEEPFHLSTAEKPLNSSSTTVAGWSVINPDECWERHSSVYYRVDILPSYVDKNQNVGSMLIDPNSPAVHHHAARVTNQQYCIDPINRFSLTASSINTNSCPEELLKANFPITVAGGSSTHATINLSASSIVPHTEENIFFPPQNEPQQPTSSNPSTSRHDISSRLYHEKSQDLRNGIKLLQEGKVHSALNSLYSACLIIDEACIIVSNVISEPSISSTLGNEGKTLSLMALHVACYRNHQAACIKKEELIDIHGPLSESQITAISELEELSLIESASSLTNLDESLENSSSELDSIREEIERERREIEILKNEIQ